MAEQDASVAIQNALQKLDQQPTLLHNDEKLMSVKSKLRRVGSHLDRINSIPKLTEVREIAYDVEDAIDDAIMVAAATAAHRRWRMLGHLFLFLSRTNKINQQRIGLEELIDSIDILTTSVDQSIRCDNAPTSEGGDDKAMKENRLFYLSLSGFPAEIEISARQLIQIWAADGFLKSEGCTYMEEQGRDRINWLLDRGFITEGQRGTCGNLKTFKIKKEKLDPCIKDAKEEDFLHVKIYTGGIAEIRSKLNATRLAIHNESTIPLSGNSLSSFADLSKVRSLQIHCNNSNSKIALDCGFPMTLKKEFESLWILDLGSLELETVPEAIGKLTHLKYLRLRAPEASRIPASICNLPNLQTIDLKETKRVKVMPVEIWKMKTNLCHLHLGGAVALPPPWRINHYIALQNLQTLCGVSPDKELKRLMVRAKFPNVKRLRLHMSKKGSVSNKKEFLSFLNSLDLLYHLRSLTLRGPIEGLPHDWNAFPSSLTKMTLSQTQILVDHCIKTLQNLPNLTYLKLMEDSVTGKTMEFASGGFPALELLRMEGIKDLECWSVKKDAMRFLRELTVECVMFNRVKAIQPSTRLQETLQKLQNDHPDMTIEVDPSPATA